MRTFPLLTGVLTAALLLALGASGQSPRLLANSTVTDRKKHRQRHPFSPTIDSVMAGLLQEFAVPGAAIALIQKGEVVWMRGFGFANAVDRTPITSDTVSTLVLF